ncbi:metal-dependent transcriptional regulator [Candidatus Bathyarchaeota archaeon]|nr:MAG: metal-dependent transcriptional regulator [Candidatus Bathyarchaeota archaeon]RLI28995.1 MAG: metal-dependent transcriptional regulator [Candidatus Bathyarchaeota archaeon]
MAAQVSRRAEDYLRIIYEVVSRKGYARIKDIAISLNVKPATAVEMMKKLKHENLVNYEKYGGVTLTPRGKEIAEIVKKRHDVFQKFLEILLVPKDIASKDAHILEHQLDPKTILQFTRFVEFVVSSSERPKFVERWMEHFRKYCEQQERSKI